MNRASAVVTCGGGSDCVPIAWRSSDRTMMMRTKHVVIRRIVGASEITVSRTMMFMTVESPRVCVGSGPCAVEPGVAGPPGMSSDAAPMRSMGLSENDPGSVTCDNAGTSTRRGGTS
jgi:hypothetical protein